MSGKVDHLPHHLGVAVPVVWRCVATFNARAGLAHWPFAITCQASPLVSRSLLDWTILTYRFQTGRLLLGPPIYSDGKLMESKDYLPFLCVFFLVLLYWRISVLKINAPTGVLPYYTIE